jgi:hypothetical protein
VQWLPPIDLLDNQVRRGYIKNAKVESKKAKPILSPFDLAQGSTFARGRFPGNGR